MKRDFIILISAAVNYLNFWFQYLLYCVKYLLEHCGVR